jgi:hypothetical protein
VKLNLIKVLIVPLVLGLVAISAPARAGNDLSWIPEILEPTVHTLAFTDKLPSPEEHSVLTSWKNPDAHVCTSTKDQYCGSSDQVVFNSILKVCSNSTDTDCVSQVNAIDSSGTSAPGKFSKYTITNHLNSFAADPKLGIPEGSMPSIWSIPSAPHASGSDYAVFAAIAGGVDQNGKEILTGGTNNFMQLSLIPVVLKDFGKGHQSISAGGTQAIPGTYYDYCADSQEPGKASYPDCSHVNGKACLFATVEQGICYAEEAFGAIQKFNLQLKLSKEPLGWMHGRMIDPAIAITKDAAGGVNLSITAGALNVPMVYQAATWASIPSNLQDLWVQCGVDPQSCGSYWFTPENVATSDYRTLIQSLSGNAEINLIRYVNPYGAIPLQIMAAISPLIENKSQAVSSTWSMRTLSVDEMNGANNCFTNTPGLKGIVTTNSTAYSAGPPTFKDGSLNYQVASPHFEPDGVTPFRGTYNLVMRSDVARCIYGFSKAPIKATISVISSEGANDVATTVANEKDGWLYLSANNFQFSSPTIQVKLSQDAPTPAPSATPVVTVTPTPAATVTPAPKAPVKSSITCIRGKITKSVTAVKPTCPTGYKKK